jgi:hypothetical protein
VKELLKDYGGVLRKLLSEKSLAIQMPALVVAHNVCVEAGLPKVKVQKKTKCLLEAVFMTLLDADIIEKATFMEWMSKNAATSSFKQVRKKKKDTHPPRSLPTHSSVLLHSLSSSHPRTQIYTGKGMAHVALDGGQ